MKRSAPLKRTPLPPRRTPLKRSTKPIARVRGIARSPIKRTAGKPKRFAKLRNREYCAWIRTLPCILWGEPGDYFDDARVCAGPVECAHVKSRGAGGSDVANTVPLCRRHHREQHDIGIRSFETRYRVNLELKALVFGALQPPHLSYGDIWRAQRTEGAA